MSEVRFTLAQEQLSVPVCGRCGRPSAQGGLERMQSLIASSDWEYGESWVARELIRELSSIISQTLGAPARGDWDQGELCDLCVTQLIVKAAKYEDALRQIETQFPPTTATLIAMDVLKEQRDSEWLPELQHIVHAINSEAEARELVTALSVAYARIWDGLNRTEAASAQEDAKTLLARAERWLAKGPGDASTEG